jgi:hypothetical protein
VDSCSSRPTAITHLRDVLAEQTYESLARKGETMTTAAMVTYAYDQIENQHDHPETDPPAIIPNAPTTDHVSGGGGTLPTPRSPARPDLWKRLVEGINAEIGSAALGLACGTLRRGPPGTS